MTVWRSLTLLGALFVTATLQASDDALPFAETEGCMEGPLAQFGRYIGDWKIEDEQLAQDGTWGPGQGARWVFSCLGNGTAVQDFWYPNAGGVGTNLRSYNSETGAWEVVWAVTGKPGFTRISAKQDAQGDIVMDFVAPIPTPLRRITFMTPDESGWKWKLELSQDGGENWFEAYRITATPWE